MNDAEVTSGPIDGAGHSVGDRVKREIDNECSLHKRNTNDECARHKRANDNECVRHRERMLVLLSQLSDGGNPSIEDHGNRVDAVIDNVSRREQHVSSTRDACVQATDGTHDATLMTTTNSTTHMVTNETLCKVFSFTGRDADYVLYHEIWAALDGRGLTIGEFDVIKGLKNIGGVGSKDRKRTRGGKQDRYLSKIQIRE